MRILQVLSSLSMTAGVPNVIMNYYRTLISKHINIKFDFLIFDEATGPNYENYVKKYGSNIYKIHKPSFKTISSYCMYLDNFFKENKDIYDIIELHDLYLTLFVFSYAKKWGIKHRIVHSHGTMYSDRFLGKIRNMFLYKAIPILATDYIACSQSAANFAFPWKKFSNKKIFICQNAIDVSKFKFDVYMRKVVRAKYCVDGKIIFGHVGQFTEVKNHIFLLKVFSECLKIRDDLQLWLIGEGRLKENLVSFINTDYKLKNHVHFWGSVKNVNELMQAMDIFIFPSLREGLPLSVVEAQAAGLRVYLTDTISHEVDIGGCVFLNNNEAPAKWAALILNDFDENKNMRICCSNNKFDIDINAVKLLKFYNKIIE